MENLDPRVDAFIAKSADFAKPILTHLRQLVHTAHPGITETMKWSMPFFDYKGPVCQMAAFKQHAAFGFWRATALSDPNKILDKGDGEERSAGSIGKLTSLADLPADEVLIEYIREAVKLNESGEKATMKIKDKPAAPKKEIAVSEEFINALDANPALDAQFSKFSPSKQNEYLSWFAEAKSDATRTKRIEQALEWIAEGKSRHWKYQS